MQIFKIETHHFWMFQRTRGDESQHGVARREQDLRLRFERLRLKAVLQRWPVLLFRHFDVAFTSRIQGLGIPSQRLDLVDGSLYGIAKRTRPVNGETRAKLVPDIDGIPDAKRGILAHLR